MPLLARLRSFWRNAVHRSDMEREMADEVRFHLARRADDLIHRGVPPDEASRIARVEFGSVEMYKEEARHSLGLRPLDELHGDLRYAFRAFARTPGFTAAAVATLALGIGANTAIFSVIDSVMLRLLAVEHPEQLSVVLMQQAGRAPKDGFTNALWEAIRDQQDVFSGVFAWSTPKPFAFAMGGATGEVRALMVSGSYFTTLGVTPHVGRLIADPDDRRGCAPVVVLSYGFWQTRFAGSGAAVGSTIALARQPFDVIGVSPARFHGMDVGSDFDVALPLCASALFDKRNLDSRSRWWLSVAGSARPGMTADRINARLAVLSPGIMRAAAPGEDPADQQAFLAHTLTSAPAATGASELRAVFRQPLNLLMAIVALVLLIACANIAGLLLARAATRGKEIAIRKAIGASRGRLIRQFLTESLVLSSAGALVGVLIGKWGSAALARGLSTGRNPIFLDLSLDGRVLGFTILITVLTTVLIGLLPAVRSTRIASMEAMKARSAAGGGQRSRFRAGKWIVAGQLALSLVLLIASGLLLRSFGKLLTLDLGFDRNNVLVVSAKPPWFAADTAKLPPEQRQAAYDEIAQRLRAIPGVTAVARSFTTPIGDDNWMTTVHTSAAGAPGDREGTAYFNFVTPGYFATMRSPLSAGRDFDVHDTATSARVAVVNETMARRFFPGMAVVGSTFRRWNEPDQIEIVGIVKDTKYEAVRQATPPTVFLPATQAPPSGHAEEFSVRTDVPPERLVPAVQRAVTEVTRDIPLRIDTLAEQVDDNLVQDRVIATLSGFFGSLALLLAMVGLYGVLSYVVTERQVEFGIRMALGARPASVLRLVMRDVTLIVIAGVAGGLTTAFVGVTLLERMLFGLAPRDPVTMVSAVGVLAAMALVAAYLPARRAIRMDPMAALRAE
jgi:predicted permease